jgi:hypothetical protein
MNRDFRPSTRVIRTNNSHLAVFGLHASMDVNLRIDWSQIPFVAEQVRWKYCNSGDYRERATGLYKSRYRTTLPNTSCYVA